MEAGLQELEQKTEMLRREVKRKNIRLGLAPGSVWKPGAMTLGDQAGPPQFLFTAGEHHQGPALAPD